MLSVAWNFLASSRAMPSRRRWLSSLIGFLKSVMNVIRSPSGPKKSFWKLNGSPPFGPASCCSTMFSMPGWKVFARSLMAV